MPGLIGRRLLDPLVADVKCTKLLVEDMSRIGRVPVMKTNTDYMSSRAMVKLPGFVDVHVHLREPDTTYKEDFDSGTAATVAGGHYDLRDPKHNTADP
ncbi:hypothetical protein pipiens_010533 [Culex pipiens pipiens]|uniref:Dihydroorotase n=1 Tax=Culex pipiens pipiens TaxID=38569 RepID=A0ABD1DBF0_CULPP